MKKKLGIFALIILVILIPLGISMFKDSIDDKEDKTLSPQLETGTIERDTEAPIITLVNTKLSIERGSEINYKAQIDKAKDNKDGTLTKKVKWNEIDVDEVGEHKVVYTVKDEAGNKGETVLIVVVNESANNPYYAPTAEDDR